MNLSLLFKDKEVVYRRFGHRQKVIMLVHGFPEDGSVFKHQYNFLKEYFTVLVPDLPGSGLSAYNERLHSVEDFAEVLFEILQKEKIEKCFLIGHSMGGYISLAFAEKHPQKLLGLSLLHSTAFADSEEKKESRRRSIKLMEEYGSYRFLKSVLPGLFGASFRQHHPEVIEALLEKGKNFEVKALQQYYTIMILRPDRTQVLKNIGLPVLFIVGEEDKAVPPSDAMLQVALSDTAIGTTLSNVAHMGFLENADATNMAIKAFAALL